VIFMQLWPVCGPVHPSEGRHGETPTDHDALHAAVFEIQRGSQGQ